VKSYRVFLLVLLPAMACSARSHKQAPTTTTQRTVAERAPVPPPPPPPPPPPAPPPAARKENPAKLPVPRGEYQAKGPLAVPKYLRGRYLDLIKMALTDLLYENDAGTIEARKAGMDWPSRAITMIGLKRLDNVQMCAEDVLLHRVPGDFIEAGVWRGGATMLMKAMLNEYGDTTRSVWVADSFEGLPPPDPDKYPADKGGTLHEAAILAASLPEVRSNFERFGLLDDRVKFLKGWFKDTLHTAPIKRLAVLRVDGDLYESTMDTLVPLYPKLSPGGYCIVDDYFNLASQKQAVDDYRREHGITEEIKQIDWAGAYWQKRK
jgi:O-methyltransferase